METGYEGTIEKKKLGGGIITLAVLTFVFNGLGIIASGVTLSVLDTINKTSESLGMPTLSSTEIIIGIIVAIIGVVGFILILFRKKLGVYLYFASIVLNIIINIMSIASGKPTSALTYIGMAVGLIIPILLAVFLRKKFKYFT